MKSKLRILRVPSFFIFLIPSFILHWINFFRNLLLYRSISISPKSFLINTKLGKNILIGGGIYFCDSFVGDHTYFAGSEGDSIHSHINKTIFGKYCSVGHNLEILHGSHTTQTVTTYPFYSNPLSFLYNRKCSTDCKRKETKIGNDVWIGANVTIIGGITIGDGAVIGAGSVVTKNIEPYAIMAGVPAKRIRYRFEKNAIDRLLQLKWWDWTEEKIAKNTDFLMNDFPDPKFEQIHDK